MEPKRSLESASSSSSAKRVQKDLKKLIMKGYKVEMVGDRMDVFAVEFHGPAGSLYAGYIWTVLVVLPGNYPISPPVMWFKDAIYHPNITATGVCLDILKDKWNPSIALVTLFDLYIPQLLMEPNPLEARNTEAAIYLLADPNKYANTVEEHCKLHARPDKKADTSSDVKHSGDKSSSSKEQASGQLDP